MTIDSFDVLFYTSIFIVPGFIIRSIVESMSPSAKKSDSVYFISCLTYSIANCAIWSWLYSIIYENRNNLMSWYWILLILITLFGATLLAIIIGLVKQKEIVSRIFTKSKVNYINPIPSAWDYYFAKQNPSWVIVTLLDGSKIYGRYDRLSFASSDRDERDIYIEEIYNIDENNKWHKNELSQGILVSKDNLKTIEFIK